MKHFLFWITLLSSATTPVLAKDIFLTASKQSAFRSALDDLSIAIANHDYTLTKIQPIDEGLRQKGYHVSDYKVLFFSNHEQVSRVLTDSPEASVLLPLKIILYQKGNSVVASAPSLKIWKGFFGDTVNPMIDQWDRDIQEILKDFSKQQRLIGQRTVAGN